MTAIRTLAVFGAVLFVSGCAPFGTTADRGASPPPVPGRAEDPASRDAVRRGRRDLAAAVTAIATELERQTLLYDVEPLTDCSGIFHRFLSGLRARYPTLDTPDAKSERDTRSLARWYHERGRLTLVRDATAKDDLIRPGAVLFYGRQRKRYPSGFDLAALLDPRGGIKHMGVVIDVSRDRSGRVVSYRLFHGHGKRGVTPAGVTDYHRRSPSRPSYSPYGNGTQQWVAVASLVPG